MQLKKINQKLLAKDGRLKRYHNRVNKYNQNREFQNYERKLKQQVGSECTKTYQQPVENEAKLQWSIIWKWKDYDRKAERVNNTEKRISSVWTKDMRR